MNKIIRFKQLSQIIPLSRSSLWRRIKKGSFPQAISLGGIAVGWLEEDILRWIEKQKNTPSFSSDKGGDAQCNKL